MVLSNRLETCLAYLEGFQTLYDVGTDHAYLPIAAVQRGLVNKAYAVDNKKSPLESARTNVAMANLETHVIPLLSDGLNAIEPSVDVIVVAGLGGSLIYKILRSCAPGHVRRLIVQTSVNAQIIRTLVKNGWQITDESVIEEGGVYYTTIVFDPGQACLSQRHQEFGPVLLKKRPEAYIKQLNHEAIYLRGLIAKIPDVKAKIRHIDRLQAIEEVLDERHDD